jgi:hypothetical protein
MMEDRRQAEAMYLIVVSMLLLGLLLAQYLIWALLNPTILSDPAGPVALTFWGTQVGGFVLCGLLCFLGFKPAVSASIEPNGIHLRQGQCTASLTYDEIESVEPLSALLFHRHYARYAATQAFISRMPATLLLIRTPDDPVVVGLRPEDHTALLHHLNAEQAPVFDLPTARVA